MDRCELASTKITSRAFAGAGRYPMNWGANCLPPSVNQVGLRTESWFLSFHPFLYFYISGRLQITDCSSKFDLASRRGSAPSDLLRNTSASIASCWIQFRDRIKVKVRSPGTNLVMLILMLIKLIGSLFLFIY